MKKSFLKKDEKYSYEDWKKICEISENKFELNKFELIDGKLYMVEKADIIHDVITSTLNSILVNKLENTPYEVVTGTLAVKIKNVYKNRYYLPDIVIFCDETEEEIESNEIEYPTLIIEILSKGTKAKDLGDKLEDYLNIDGLKGYLVVNQEIKEITLYEKIDGFRRKSTYVAGESLKIDSLFELFVDEVYQKVEERLGD